MMNPIDVIKEFLVYPLWFKKKKCHYATVYGSARVKEGEPYYELGRNVGKICAQKGYGVITGGGPGLMQAANEGAFKNGGDSVGFNIVLPHEQKSNPFVKEVFVFKYFSSRKIMLSRFSSLFIILPGGFGTVDELFEILTLMQTKKQPIRPVVLLGKSFWAPLLSWLEEKLLREKMISEEGLKMFTLLDSLEDLNHFLK